MIEYSTCWYCILQKFCKACGAFICGDCFTKFDCLRSMCTESGSKVCVAAVKLRSRRKVCVASNLLTNLHQKEANFAFKITMINN